MSLIDIMTQAGGGAAINDLGARVGLTPAQVTAAMAALTPAIASGLGQHARTGDLGATINSVTAGVGEAAAVDQGNAILGQIFGSRDVSRAVADHAAGQTGISSEQLRAMLPLLASLAATALASHAGQQAAGAAPAAPAPTAGGGIPPATPAAASQSLGAAGAQILVAMLDRDGDGSPLNDILRMGGSLFRR